MGGGLFDTTERQQVYIALNLVTTVIGSAASVLTLLVIHRLKMTGHILLISTMTWFQLIYDVFFFFTNVDIGYWWLTAANSFQILGGVAGSLISNHIAYIAFHVVFYRKSYKVFDNYPMILTTSLVPAVANTIVLLVGSIPRNADPALIDLAIVVIYYGIRLLSIAFNFMLCGATVYLTHRMMAKKQHLTNAELAIRTLSRRMVFYPILQAISRSGYAWYEASYGAHIQSDKPSNTQYAALIFLTVITPTVSIGYLVILLIMQPYAYNEFKRIFGLEVDAMKSRDEAQPHSSSSSGGERNPLNRTNSAVGFNTHRHDSSEVEEPNPQIPAYSARGSSRAGCSADFSAEDSARDYSSVYGASVMSAMSPTGGVTYGDWGEASGHDPRMTSSVLLRFSSAPPTSEYAFFAELAEEDLMMQVDRAYNYGTSAPPTIDGRYRGSRASEDAKERLLQVNSMDEEA